jgi:hypothetical protein
MLRLIGCGRLHCVCVRSQKYAEENSMTKRLALFAALAAVVVVAQARAQAPTADTILVNGKVITPRR